VEAITTNSSDSDEYKTLRDETLKRVDARNQLLSYTLAFAAAMFTVALGASSFSSALLVYPVVAFFFAAGFAYNSLLLIEIGAYLRTLETRSTRLGWATHLGPRYRRIEVFELISTAGLFLSTEGVGLLIYYNFEPAKQNAPTTLVVLAWIAFALTIAAVIYPWLYHRDVLKAP
jgi:hypothetical protein